MYCFQTLEEVNYKSSKSFHYVIKNKNTILFGLFLSPSDFVDHLIY